jgi:hypothetical protein
LARAPGEGNDTLKRYFPDAVFRRNVIIGGTAGRYPSTTSSLLPSRMPD